MDADSKKFKNSIYISLSFVVILWCIKYVEFAMHYDFARFGIHPRHLSGVLGIITGPLIHGDFSHLASNTLPLLILVIGLFYFYQKIALEVILWIYFMTGFWVWIAARGEAYHIGASGLVYGLVSFLFFSGVFRKDTASIAVSLIVVFLYGGMFWGILPISEQISWESHILGAIAGILCSFYFRFKTPVPKFDWKEEDDELSNNSTASTNSTYELYRNYTYTYTFESSLPNDPEAEKDEIK
jgi:membrane associated rhomboid family serine protease